MKNAAFSGRAGSPRVDSTVRVLIWFVCALLAVRLVTAQQPRATENELSSTVLNVAALMVDDAFYYQRIAANVATGNGSTFDGEHSTNGYHPLWMLVLVPVNWLGVGRHGVLLATFAIQALLLGGTASALFSIARSVFLWRSSAAAVLLWLVLQTGYCPSFSGMEYALQAYLIARLMLETTRLDPTGATSVKWTTLRWTALLCLAFLARLDNLLLGAALLAATAIGCAGTFEPRSLLRRQRGPMVLASCGLGLTAAAYLAVNRFYFGAALPVSAVPRREWSVARLEADPVYLERGLAAAKIHGLGWPFEYWPGTEATLFVLGTVGIGAALLVSTFGAWRILPRHLSRALAPFVVFGIAQAALYSVLFHGGYQAQPWYYPVQGLLAALLGAALLDAAAKWSATSPTANRSRLTTFLTVVLLVGLCVRVGWATERKRNQLSAFPSDPLYVAARWIDTHLPDGAVVGAWNAGTMSQFSKVRVVNLDGLVNSADFLRRGRHDLCAYWREEGITYLVDVFDSREPFAAFYAQAADCLDDLERVWTAPPYPGASWRVAAYRVSLDTTH